jgi:hypothetical protein
LAETKNGAVIRKHMGYSHIAARGAERIRSFYECYFNTYLNFHRPCAQPDVEVRSDGKRIRRCKRYRTPLETLMALPPAMRDLRPGLSAEALQSQAQRQSDTEAARQCGT